jgi:hypothetical protein
MVKVAGSESTGTVALVDFKGIFLPVLPAVAWEMNRIEKAMRGLNAAADLAAGLAKLIASRENMAIGGASSE